MCEGELDLIEVAGLRHGVFNANRYIFNMAASGLCAPPLHKKQREASSAAADHSSASGSPASGASVASASVGSTRAKCRMQITTPA